MSLFLSSYLRGSELGLVILCLALVAQWGLNSRVPSAWRVWLWRVALLQTALALVPLTPVNLPLLSPPPPATLLQEAVFTSKVTPASQPLQQPKPPNALSENDSPSSSSKSSLPQSSTPLATTEALPTSSPFGNLNWSLLPIFIYLLGLLVHLMWLLRSAVRVRRTLHVCSPIESFVPLDQLRETAARLNIRQLPHLLQCKRTAPFLVGVLNSTIVLPSALLKADNSQLQAVFAHELAHHVRRDLVWNAIMWLLATLLWFHPLAWVARRFHALEVESACDELVLRSTSISPQSYGELLLNAMNFHQSPLTAGVGDGFFALKTRLLRLNQTPTAPRRPARIAFAAALALTFSILVPFRLVARVQANSTASSATEVTVISGTVRNKNGQPIKGAEVYFLDESGNEKLNLKTFSDDKGEFHLSTSQPHKRFWGHVLADAGQEGMTAVSVAPENEISSLNLKVKPGVQAKVRLLDPTNQPVKDLKVQVRNLWLHPGQPISLPHWIGRRLNATSNTQGEAVFPPLPAGMWVTFQLESTSRFERLPISLGKFAPLAPENYVALSATAPVHTIHLLAPVRLTGQITLGTGGKPATSVWVYAERVITGGVGYQGDSFPVDADGNYQLTGLRPGKYRVRVLGNKWENDWVTPVLQPNLTSPINHLNIVLVRGSLVEGVVVSQKTKRPVQGVKISLRGGQGISRTLSSDSQGRFRFRVLEGQQRMRVLDDGTTPPRGFRLPAQSSFDFALQKGENRNFRIELPSAPIARPVTGVVVGTDGTPIPYANVAYRQVGFYNNSRLLSVKCDANGRFSIPLNRWPRPLQLFADAGELTTPRSTIAVGGDNVKLQVASNRWASIEGQVLDEKGQPLPSTTLRFTTTIGFLGGDESSLAPEVNGRFRIRHLRPGLGFSLWAARSGYYYPGTREDALQPGQKLKLDVIMRRPISSLRGRVLTADGKPAGGYHISASGSGKPIETGADGSFSLPHVLSGPLLVWVQSPKQAGQTKFWNEIKARGGDENATIKLSSSASMISWSSPPPPLTRYVPLERGTNSALVGQMAPEIHAASWSNNSPTPLSSLRGQVVLLAFANFQLGLESHVELRDVAPSFADRIKVVGVEINYKGKTISQQDLLDSARRTGMTIALDTRQGSGGQTYRLYKARPYVVIGRSGKIAYAGNELDRALNTALALSK